MAFDRSKYKATKVEAIKEQEAFAKTVVQSNNNRVDFLKIDMGFNKFRIYPAHNDGEPFAVAKCVHWIPQLVAKRDDQGNVIKKNGKEVLEERRLPIFNGRIHSAAGVCVIEKYIEYALNLIKESGDTEAVQKVKIDAITNWQNGITPRLSWVMYAHKINGKDKELGRLELSNAQKERLNKMAIVEDADQPIETDPYTCPDTGKAITIEKEKKTKGGREQTEYNINIEFRNDYRLSDEELERFSTLDPLTKMFVNSYTSKDYERAIEGLQLFDEKHDIGVFTEEAWIDILEELSGLYPDPENKEKDEEEEEEEQPKKPTPVAARAATKEAPKPVAAPKAKPEGIDGMERAELKAYIKENALGITVTPKMSDDDIREFIREAEAAQGEEAESEEPWEMPEEDQTPKVETPVSDRLAKFRKK